MGAQSTKRKSGPDTAELIADISEKCGLSEDIVRRVHKAQSEVVTSNLLKGYKVNIPGLGTFRPEIRSRLGIGCTMSGYIKPIFSVSSIIATQLEKQGTFETCEGEDEDDGLRSILVMQIPSLS